MVSTEFRAECAGMGMEFFFTDKFLTVKNRVLLILVCLLDTISITSNAICGLVWVWNFRKLYPNEFHTSEPRGNINSLIVHSSER